MAFNKKTIRDIEIAGKKVLVRVDYNLPGDDSGKVTDNYRIQASLPTLHYLLDQDCSLVLISHRGRPDGEKSDRYSLKQVAKSLTLLMDRSVKFVDDCISDEAFETSSKLKPGEVLLLENLRFHNEEEENDDVFAQKLAKHGELFVQDAFGVAHRKHASLDAITNHLESVAGLLLEKEVNKISDAINNPKHPLVAILGGAKVRDKIDLIDMFIKKADILVVGGAIANTFLHDNAFGSYNIGNSMYDKGESEIVRRVKEDLQESNTELILPLYDVIVGPDPKSNESRVVSTNQVSGNDVILDYGPESLKAVVAAIQRAGTVIWNGTVGYAENPTFAQGSLAIARTIAKSPADGIVGGGDTAGFVHGAGLADKFEHVSTGGGAALELMAGKKLPGVEALEPK